MINMIYPWQKEIWSVLQSRCEHMPHALLVHGPQGIGKLELADRLAQSILCETASAKDRPCGDCAGCRWFAAGSHPDFRRIEPEAQARLSGSGEDADSPVMPSARGAKPSNDIKVDQIRGLDGFLNLKSHRGGPRVALVHPAEAMNPNAANALLKGLEEPPGGAMFILVSHRPARLLATIRSRCVAVPVPVPDVAASLAWLEKQEVRDSQAWLSFGSGSPLQALAYAGEVGGVVRRHRKALEAGDMDTLGAVNDREELEALAEVLQKHALDRAFAAYCGRSKYSAAGASKAGAAWLRYARLLGRDRALTRHPLNPRLFAAEMLRVMPKA